MDELLTSLLEEIARGPSKYMLDHQVNGTPGIVHSCPVANAVKARIPGCKSVIVFGKRVNVMRADDTCGIAETPQHLQDWIVAFDWRGQLMVNGRLV